MFLESCTVQAKSESRMLFGLIHCARACGQHGAAANGSDKQQ